MLIALDEARGINNGQPSLWAGLFDQLDIVAGEQVLHLGCGTGYYSAGGANELGCDCKVTAIEIDAGLAERARAALARWPQASVLNVDGSSASLHPADMIIASAGATHPLPAWLDALNPRGRLLMAGIDGTCVIRHGIRALTHFRCKYARFGRHRVEGCLPWYIHTSSHCRLRAW